MNIQKETKELSNILDDMKLNYEILLLRDTQFGKSNVLNSVVDKVHLKVDDRKLSALLNINLILENIQCTLDKLDSDNNIYYYINIEDGMLILNKLPELESKLLR